MKDFIKSNFVIKYKKSFGLNSVKLRKKWFQNNGYSKQYDYIFETTNFLSDSVTLSERLYCIMNDYTEKPKCLYCDNSVKYGNYVEGYRKHCGKHNCIYKFKKEYKDENGLTSYNKSGIGISKNRLIIESNGKTKAKNNVYKTLETRKNTIINGKNLNQISIEKCKSTKMNTILSNGLTISQNAAIKAAKTMENTFIDGISLKELRIKKSIESKNKINEYGLDGHERGFLNGAGKNSSIKYYSNELYYQGTYEKHFLDFMTKNNLINNIKRGNRFTYFYNDTEHQYRSDFIYNNIIFEIKSSWTYGKKDQIKRIKNHLKFKSVLDNNCRLIVIFDKKYFIEICNDNISVDNLYELDFKPLQYLINYILQ